MMALRLRSEKKKKKKEMKLEISIPLFTNKREVVVDILFAFYAVFVSRTLFCTPG